MGRQRKFPKLSYAPGGMVKVTQQRTATHGEVMTRLKEIAAEQRAAKYKKSAARARNIEMRENGRVNGNWKLYILKLAGSKYYVGITRIAAHRAYQHLTGKGAYWTKRHPVISLESITDLHTKNRKQAEWAEDQKTIELAKLHGKHSVRGGQWCGREDIPI
jgi:predicted GIY-YIG superfamily endonuclease